MIKFKSEFPSQNLVGLSEARHHLRIDDTSEDISLSQYIATASAMLDGPSSVIGLPIIRRDHTGVGKIASRIDLDIGPNAELVTIELLRGGNWEALSPLPFRLTNIGPQSARMELQAGSALPAADLTAENIRITVSAGYGVAPSDPALAPLRQACLLLISHYFENRSTSAFGGGFGVLPMGVSALIAPYCRLVE